MAYNAAVCKVMVASPSDVQQERALTREMIWQWNYIHSERTSIALIPVGWETHSAPAMGDRPQAIVNKQVLAGCDLLIGIFWTRIGTPTGQEDSGTIEEIKEHIAKGRPAMLYFSTAPVRPDSVDVAQYERLKAFREECKTKGLISMYNDTTDFKEQLSRHLVKTVDDNDYFRGLTRESTQSGPQIAPEHTRTEPQLSEEARLMLLQAAQDHDGSVLKILTSGGLTIQVNRQNMVSAPKDPRCQAKWKAALDELCEGGFLEPVGYEGSVFNVTNKGYEMADRLKAAE